MFQGMQLESEFLDEEDFKRKLKKVKHKNSDDFEAEPSFKGDRARILTYNMFLRPIVKNNISDYKYERLEEFATVLDDFDIICNQEVFSGFNSFKPTLLTLAKKTGFLDYITASNPGFFSKFAIDSGLVILSRFPILERGEYAYTKFTGDCAAAKKGILYAKIGLRGHYLHLFNTHLQANYYPSFSQYEQCINNRMHQLQELTDFVKEKTENIDPNDKILVVGDFNISSRKFNNVLIDHFKDKAKRDPGFGVFLHPHFD
jgi:endonuclease/exonuclease/phosphatase family metal-dependent hydrolase